MLLWNLFPQWVVGHSLRELLLDSVQVPKESLMIFDFLVENRGGLLVELVRHIVRVDQGLCLIKPLADLSKFPWKCSVK